MAKNPDSIDELISAGKNAIIKNDFQKASDFFQKVLEIEPDNSVAKFYHNISTTRLSEQKGGKNGSLHIIPAPSEIPKQMNADEKSMELFECPACNSPVNSEWFVCPNCKAFLIESNDTASDRSHEKLDELITAGKNAYKDNDFKQAVYFFEEALKLDPENNETKFFIKRSKTKLSNHIR
jgi:tetratricopeptide (TPR) repeat protein